MVGWVGVYGGLDWGGDWGCRKELGCSSLGKGCASVGLEVEVG